MLLYAFQDESGQWHGDPDTRAFDGEHGTGVLRYRPIPGSVTRFAGQRLRVRYGPCALEPSTMEVHLEDGLRLWLTWHVFELLEAGPAPDQTEAAEETETLPGPAAAVGKATLPATPVAPRNPSTWTPEHDQLCHARFMAGDSPQAIATLLGRTVNAVRFRLARMGLQPFPADLLPARREPQASPCPAPFPTRDRIRQTYPNAYNPWSPEEEATMLRMAAQGADPAQIAACLQRQPSAVEARMWQRGAGGTAGGTLRNLPSWDDDGETGTSAQ